MPILAGIVLLSACFPPVLCGQPRSGIDSRTTAEGRIRTRRSRCVPQIGPHRDPKGEAPLIDEHVERSIDQFVMREIAYLTVLASFQHAKIYADRASPAERAGVRNSLCNELELLADDYVRGPVSDENHVQHIVAFADKMTKLHGRVLHDSRFRVGITQKAVNLYLKYCWCFGRTPHPPPHCPFDRTIIQMLPGCEDINFTQFDDVETYRRLATAAKAEAGSKPIAEWELVLFNEAQDL